MQSNLCPKKLPVIFGTGNSYLLVNVATFRNVLT